MSSNCDVSRRDCDGLRAADGFDGTRRGKKILDDWLKKTASAVVFVVC